MDRLRVEGSSLKFGVSGSGFQVQGLGFQVEGLGLIRLELVDALPGGPVHALERGLVKGSRFGVWGCGLRVEG